MNEQSPPPPLPPTAPSKGRFWWIAWMFATVFIPGSTLLLLAASPADKDAGLAIVCLCLLGVVAVVLNIVSSVKLSKGGSGWLTFGLILGGLVLMLVSFFVGCIMLVSVSP